MSGTDRVRHCAQCDLHVYDISRLTRTEAIALIASAEGGRICGRLHRRKDGTVITRDCPVGLRALRRRVAWRASAIFTAIISLSASLFGQTRSPDKLSCDSNQVTIEKQQSDNERGKLSGIVLDPNGATLPGAKVTLRASDRKRASISTNEQGEFVFAELKPGAYSLEIASPGFSKVILSRLVLQKGESQWLRSTSKPAAQTVVVGIFAGPTSIYENGTMTISGDLIQRLPH